MNNFDKPEGKLYDSLDKILSRLLRFKKEINEIFVKNIECEYFNVNRKSLE